MQLSGRDEILRFQQTHPDSSTALSAWTQTIENNAFKHIVELRSTFGAADGVPPYTVFNICGTKYRLIAVVVYPNKIHVTHVLTHAEYDKGRWRKQK